MKTYTELIKLKTFNERFQYLKLKGRVGQPTFGAHRYLNQNLYRSKRWKQTRNGIIIRDNGCDLGIEDYEIVDCIFVHHINELTQEDIENENPCVFDENNLICMSQDTHNAVHFGVDIVGKIIVKERTPNDTCLWRI